MALSGYPPGVTGAEYAIAGPDSERDGHELCGHCGRDGDGLIQSHRSDRWFVCDRCGETTALEWPEPDWDEENERRRDLAMDRDLELDREYGA